jgi:hypothetical protein
LSKRPNRQGQQDQRSPRRDQPSATSGVSRSSWWEPRASAFTSVLSDGQQSSEPNSLRTALILSSSLLIDRVLLHTNFLDLLGEQGVAVDVWASSVQNPAYRNQWTHKSAVVQPLPAVKAFRELIHNYPRRLNEALWDRRQHEPSRLSMMRHRPIKRGNKPAWLIDRLARGLALLSVERPLDDMLERWLLRYERSAEATYRLRHTRPRVVVTTGPFQFEQPAIAAAALRLGIRTLALIPSWDNISTKRRMIFKYDGYMVWSERLKVELHERYPHTRDKPVYVVGAPQFDVFFQQRFRQTREAFCASQGLDPKIPIVVYAVGSPNFLSGEPYGALELAKAVERGELGDVQLLVRPHPLHDHDKLAELFRDCDRRIHLQRTAVEGTPVSLRSQDEAQIVEWINTFQHAAVVVNLSSTVTVDAAICDRPVVNLDFDPSPGRADQQLIKEINHHWTHFKPIAESDGLWLVNDVNEMKHAVRTYLAKPELHREGRQWISRYVCGYPDGACGRRMAAAIVDFLARAEKSDQS